MADNKTRTPEEIAAAKEKAAKELSKKPADTRPQTRDLKEKTAEEISAIAQVRRVVDPTAVGNEFVEKVQDVTEPVAETPKEEAPELGETDIDRGARLASRRDEPETRTASRSAQANTAPKKSKYVVKGANVHTEQGKKKPGDVVELTAKEAKHLNKHGALAPYIEDDATDEED